MRLLPAVVAAVLLCPLVGCTGPADTSGTPSASPFASPKVTDPHSTGPTRTPAKVMLGSYLGLSGKTQQQSVALRRDQLGRDQRIIHLYFAWEDDLPDAAVGQSPGSTLLLSWRGTAYQEITSGSQDAHIVANAKRIAKYHEPVLLRWGWEMNGDWFAWSGAQNNQDTAGYVAAWRHIHDIFAAQGVTNVAWVWVTNWNDHPTASWNAPARYYPGDDYVDWVGVDGFNLNGESADTLFGPLYRTFASHKPFMIAETGTLELTAAGNATWIDDLRTWIVAHPAVAALVWFDTDTNTDAKQLQNWRIDASPVVLAAYKRLANDPYFSG